MVVDGVQGEETVLLVQEHLELFDFLWLVFNFVLDDLLGGVVPELVKDFLPFALLRLNKGVCMSSD